MSQNLNPEVRLTDLIAPIFYDIHWALKKQTHSTFWLDGGRGSTKSSFVALQIVKGIVGDKNANGLGIRKVGDTIKDSIHATFIWAIEKLQLSMFWHVTYSPASLTYKPTGQKIIMKGLDKPLKLKSIHPKRGYFKYLWFEEGAEYNGIEELRTVRQSVFRGGDVFAEFLTFNPPADPEHWINVEQKKKKENGTAFTKSSTYLDVPRQWLGEQFIKDAEELERDNPVAYSHEYMGNQVGNNESIIFGSKYKVMAFEPQPHWDGPYLGADFGFSQDPNTLVRCWIEILPDKRKNLYIEYAEFDHRVELDDIPEMYDKVPGARKDEILADCARPETISHIKNKQFNIKGAEKWQGSVEDGITVLKSFQVIYIHTRCTEMIKEARLYSYKIDRLTKKVTADIVDKYNHGWDAVRYALSHIIKRRPKGFFS